MRAMQVFPEPTRAGTMKPSYVEPCTSAEFRRAPSPYFPGFRGQWRCCREFALPQPVCISADSCYPWSSPFRIPACDGRPQSTLSSKVSCSPRERVVKVDHCAWISFGFHLRTLIGDPDGSTELSIIRDMTARGSLELNDSNGAMSEGPGTPWRISAESPRCRRLSL